MLRIVSRSGRPALVLGVALLLLHGAAAQPGPGRRGGEPPAKDETKPSPELQAWIKALTEKMTDRQDSIRDSARAALVSIGRPALPELRKLVDGNDATAEAARAVIARIEGGRGSGGGVAPGGGRGGPGSGGGRGGSGGGTDQAREDEKDAEASFKRYDKNNDGVLSSDEMSPTLKAEWQKWDKNKDGVIDLAEYKEYYKSRLALLRAEDQRNTNPGARPEDPRGPGGRGPGGGGPGGFPGFPGGPGGRGPGGGGGGLGSFDYALRGIELTDKQKAKVEDIKAAQQKKTQELFDKFRDGKLDRDDMRDAVQKMRNDVLKDMKSVLTGEQYEKFEKAMKDGPGGRGPGGFPGGPGGRGPGGGPGSPGGGPGGRGPGGSVPTGPDRPASGGLDALEPALKTLDLTDNQKAKVEKILDAHKAKVKELSDKVRDRNELRDATAKARDELLKELNGVLTEDQYKKLEKAPQDTSRGPGSRRDRPID